ncbi:MAG: nitroreductase family protein [candidate division FCPU426 bacterium]
MHGKLIVISGLLAFSLGAAAAAAEQPAAARGALDIIHARKSVRHYLPQPVSEELLTTLMKAGMAAPTAADKRPWAFVAVTDPARRRSLAQALPYGKMLEQAGGAIVVCGLPKQSMPGKESEYWIQDCSAASENILLACEALGLGAVWVGVHPVPARVEAVRRALSLPASVVPLNVISLGYPAGVEKPKDKFDPAAIHWNQW